MNNVTLNQENIVEECEKIRLNLARRLSFIQNNENLCLHLQTSISVTGMTSQDVENEVFNLFLMLGVTYINDFHKDYDIKAPKLSIYIRANDSDS